MSICLNIAPFVGVLISSPVIVSTAAARQRKEKNMKNVKMSITDNKLLIEVDLSQSFGLSSSGKSITVASTEGNKPVPGSEEIKIGLNVYKPNK